jgi:hypothetical protein
VVTTTTTTISARPLTTTTPHHQFTTYPPTHPAQQRHHSYRFSLGGANGLTVQGELGIYNRKEGGVTNFTLTVTDGHSTLTKFVTVNLVTSTNFIIPGSNFMLDTQGNIQSSGAPCKTGCGVVPNHYTPSPLPSKLTFSPPGLWEAPPGLGNLASTAAAVPLSSHYGVRCARTSARVNVGARGGGGGGG